jgi:basic membrane protein A and related proteins
LRRSIKVSAAATASIFALALSACGSSDSDGGTASDTSSPSASSTAKSVDFKACMVSDSGGFDDKSFNQTTHDGLIQAKSDLGVQTAEVESHADSEYADNIKAMVSAGCNEITTVGFLLGDATLAAAKANPNIDFAIVDYAYSDDSGKNTAPANLKGLVFDTAQPSYLAGYLAAGTTQTGTVGVFGGQNIPTVTSYMEGYRLGVEAYNKDNSKSVKVVGWDGKDGAFTDDFEDKSKGQSIATDLINQGADIIFPVAGTAGLGGLQAAKDAGAKAIWVDTDGCVSAPEYCDILLTSVLKGLAQSEVSAVTDAVGGKFSNELYNGTLANDGVGLAKLSSDVPSDLSSKIDDLKQQIIDGTIKVG